MGMVPTCNNAVNSLLDVLLHWTAGTYTLLLVIKLDNLSITWL